MKLAVLTCADDASLPAICPVLSATEVPAGKLLASEPVPAPWIYHLMCALCSGVYKIITKQSQ